MERYRQLVGAQVMTPQMFEEQVRACPTVDVNLGWEAIEVTQTADYAQLVAQHYFAYVELESAAEAIRAHL